MSTMTDLFTDDVVQRLAAIPRPNVSEWDYGGVPVRRRHDVVRSKGPTPWQSGWALKKAWESYLEVAKECGLLDDPELVGNLTGKEDEQFRGAMAECQAAWFFRTSLGLDVKPKPEPKHGKNIDFEVSRSGLTFYVEVKAPYVPQLTNHGSGDDAGVLRGRIEAAGAQFKKGRRNVLFLVPVLRTPIHEWFGRDQLVKSVIGEPTYNVYVSLDPKGPPPPPPEPGFLQNGKLAKLHRKSDGTERADLTRISAVVSLEYVLGFTDNGEREVSPRVMVVHNPFAEVPLPEEVLGAYPQLVRREGVMEWTDRQSAA
jgi:hypothetical protein